MSTTSFTTIDPSPDESPRYIARQNLVIAQKLVASIELAFQEDGNLSTDRGLALADLHIQLANSWVNLDG